MKERIMPGIGRVVPVALGACLACAPGAFELAESDAAITDAPDAATPESGHDASQVIDASEAGIPDDVTPVPSDSNPSEPMPDPECAARHPGERFCEGKLVVECSADLHSSMVKECEFHCIDGVCAECEPGARRCDGPIPQACGPSGKWEPEGECTPLQACVSGYCEDKGPCDGLAMTCGANADMDCCRRKQVPGGSFLRSNDTAAPAGVSAFELDLFEVTVGRFRRFVDAYPSETIAEGAGRNPHDPGDPGWSATWAAQLPATRDALTQALGCGDPGAATWSAVPGPAETHPINCVSWYEAFAFCVWAGGRLPTEAEWNYAAAGGGGADGQRLYPWSAPPSSQEIDQTFASFGCSGPCISPAGAKAKGNGAWTQADMAGNVWEWAADWYGVYPIPCNDCANHGQGSSRVIRGGGFNTAAANVATAFRHYNAPSGRLPNVGFRCVYDVP